MFLCRCRRPKVGGMDFLELISQAFPRPLPQSPLVFFPALSLALFFARAPLSERLEQAMGVLKTLQRIFFTALRRTGKTIFIRKCLESNVTI